MICLGSLPTDKSVEGYDVVDGMIPPTYAPANFRFKASELLNRIHAYGTKVFALLEFVNGRVMGEKSPSEIPTLEDPSVLTQELTKEEIHKKIEDFLDAAEVIHSCGFDGLEVHAMHWGYLLDQFSMSVTNHRTDEYGGCLENRLRIAKELVEGIKKRCGADFPVTMRMGLKSYMKDYNQASLDGSEEAGRTIEESVEIAKLLESYRYDGLDVDSGVYDAMYYCTPPAYMEKGYNLKLAAQVRKAVSIPVITGGCMDDPDMAARAVEEGMTDAVALSRASFADPCYPLKVELGKPETIRPCISCLNCVSTCFDLGAPTCSVNPSSMRERICGVSKTLMPGKIAVVGGGVAGMEAAATAARRGHQVTLYERADHLGGRLAEAGSHSFKTGIKALNKWYQRELDELAVNVLLNTEVDAQTLKNEGFDAVILAIGASPNFPQIETDYSVMMMTASNALLNEKEVKGTCVIAGGGLAGCELAYDLASKGRKVTIVEMLPDILSSGPAVPDATSMMLRELLDRFGVKIITKSMVEKAEDGKLFIRSSDKTGDSQEIECDTLILATGFRKRQSFRNELVKAGIRTYEAGDGVEVANIGQAIYRAYEIARNI